MGRRYKSELMDDRRMCVGLRLIMLNHLVVPDGYTGSVAQLRKAIISDPKIDEMISHLVRLKRLELLDDCDIVECAIGQRKRIKAIARKLSNSNC